MSYEIRKLIRDGAVFAVAVVGYIAARSFGQEVELSTVALPEVGAEGAAVLGAVGLFLYRFARARTPWLKTIDPAGEGE